MVLKPGAGAPLDVLMKRKRAIDTELQARNPTPTTQPDSVSDTQRKPEQHFETLASQPQSRSKTTSSRQQITALASPEA